MKDLHRTMALADDARIAEIVTLVDALPDRGAADDLLAPLRGRLLVMRPPRRLSLSRLLFTPANAVVVAAPTWRRNSVTLPRTALRSLELQARLSLGPVAVALDARLADAGTDDRTVIMREGPILWRLAADCFRQADVPDDWVSQTGLTAGDHRAIVRPLAALLHVASTTEAFADRIGAGGGVSQRQIRACLSHASSWIGGAAAVVSPGAAAVVSPGAAAVVSPGGPAFPPPIGMLLGVLLARLPHPEDVLVATGDVAQSAGDPMIRQACDLAIDVLLASGQTNLSQDQDLSVLTHELERQALLLDALDGPGPACRPARRPALALLRREIDATCRRRFETDMAKCVSTAIDTLSADPSDVATGQVEATLRHLRNMEAAARRFGGGPGYDRSLADAARKLARSSAGMSATLQAKPDTEPDTEVRARICDIARFIEILDGPEAGLAFLAAQPFA